VIEVCVAEGLALSSEVLLAEADGSTDSDADAEADGSTLELGYSLLDLVGFELEEALLLLIPEPLETISNLGE
jgi:hypothetical protein